MKSSVLLLLVLALAVVPLAIHRRGAASAPPAEPAPGAGAAPGPAVFEGADDRASALITELRPGFTPWVSPLFEPASGEVETMLFALQAALGAGALFYYLGYARGRSARLEEAARAAPFPGGDGPTPR